MTDAAYRMPAEWEKQEAVWLCWPRNRNDWPGKFAPIPWVFAEMIRHLAARVCVRLVVHDAAAEAAAREILTRAHADLARVEFFHIPTNRGWLRDSGPIFVYDAKKKGPEGKTMLDWRAFGWAKYPNYRLDDKVPARINERLKLPRIVPMHKGRRVVLEGGGIDVNGAGCLLTTEEWLLSDVQVRNPGFTREDYEEIFEKYLGVTNTIWLGNGIVGDDTHGHIDDLARFVAVDTVVTAVERDRHDENYAPLQDSLKRLKRARDTKGKALTVVELPMPRPLYFEETRIPASYANFLISNGIVIVPTFNDPNDRLALNILAECFPKHEVIGIHAVDLVWGFGTLHCLSQQEPV